MLNVATRTLPVVARAAQDRQILKAWMLARQGKKLRMEKERLCVPASEEQLNGMPAILVHERINHGPDGGNAGAGSKKDGVFVKLAQHELALRPAKADLLSNAQFKQPFRRRSLLAGFDA